MTGNAIGPFREVTGTIVYETREVGDEFVRLRHVRAHHPGGVALCEGFAVPG